MSFTATRITHSFTQTDLASPDAVFPLLCPVREREWVPGWDARIIYSQSGLAEHGCIFVVRNADGSEALWIVTGYEPEHYKIGFVWVLPEHIATQIAIRLEAHGDHTLAHIEYCYTGLSEQGNEVVKSYTADWFRQKMLGWERAINSFLAGSSSVFAHGEKLG